uniref:Uncharacterized protein n=1 Tax=Arundo donax TaxID=35708 RepID=A0A0A9B7A2_ARUDO
MYSSRQKSRTAPPMGSPYPHTCARSAQNSRKLTPRFSLCMISPLFLSSHTPKQKHAALRRPGACCRPNACTSNPGIPYPIAMNPAIHNPAGVSRSGSHGC